MENDFARGAVFAASIAAGQFGSDTIAEQILAEVGIDSMKSLRAVTDFQSEIKILRPIIVNIQEAKRWQRAKHRRQATGGQSLKESWKQKCFLLH